MDHRSQFLRSILSRASFVRARRVQVVFLVTVALLLLVGALASCGRVSTGAAGNDTSATQTTAASATATAGGKATVANAVTITLDKALYAASDTITVTISNGLATPITVADHQTNCSIVVLQSQAGSGWQSIRNCRIMTPTRLTHLAAGSVTTVRLVPGGGQIATTPWAAGAYRVLLTYGAGASATPGSGKEATSTTFTIG